MLRVLIFKQPFRFRDFKHASAFSRREASERCMIRSPRNIRGRRESRVLAAPAASRAKKKAHERSHHRFTEFNRPSLRNGFNGFLRALPGDRAFLSPSLAELPPQT
jgi:hypothetical protein